MFRTIWLVADGTPVTLDGVDALAAVRNAPNIYTDVDPNSQTGTAYTLVLADAVAGVVNTTNSSAVTVTVPNNTTVDFPIRTYILIIQLGAGQVTVAGAAGVTVRTSQTLRLAGQYAGAVLVKEAANTWVLGGDLELAA